MLKRLLHGKTHTIASAAVIVASFSVLSRFVGFIRDRILAGEFGASDVLDIYFAAFRIPDLFFQLIIVGALSASFIPLFTKYYKPKEHKKAWELTNKLLNLLAIVFGLVVMLSMIFAPQLAPLIAPGFTEAKQVLVGDMSRIMFLGQFFLALSMVYGSALQGAKRFVIYSMAPVLYNLGIIIGVVVFVPAMGIMGLAWGVVLGTLLHFALQTVGIYALGYRYKLLFRFVDKDILYTIKHMLPRVLGLAVNQLNFVGMTILASLLVTGSVTMLQFAYNLNFFPIGVVAISYAIAAFPTFCELAQGKDKSAFKEAFSESARQIIFFIIPATILFIALRAQIVRVVLGAGLFDWESTRITADTLGFFAISLLAQSLVFLLVRAYFAYEDTVTPFIVGIVTAAVNLGVAYFFINQYGVIGFGIAYSVAATVQLIILWIPLRIRLGSLDEWRIVKSVGILSVAGMACAAATQFTKVAVVQVITLDTFFGVLSQGLIAGTAGLVSYFAFAYFFKSREMMTFLNGMQKRLFKKAKIEEEIVTEMG